MIFGSVGRRLLQDAHDLSALVLQLPVAEPQNSSSDQHGQANPQDATAGSKHESPAARAEPDSPAHPGDKWQISRDSLVVLYGDATPSRKTSEMSMPADAPSPDAQLTKQCAPASPQPLYS